MKMQDKEIIELAKEVFDIEGKAVLDLKDKLNGDFTKALRAIFDSNGKVIVTGIGKSGHIGNKIAATLASTGTPSFFVHPAEAFHGDLGMFENKDIVLCISNSGETDEILKLIPFFKKNGNLIIAMTGRQGSTLAVNSDFFIDISVEKEACLLALAPTSSTTVTLALGDAMAIALMKMRNFDEERFAEYHPGGSLGRRLLIKATDVMRKENLPIVLRDQKMIDVVNIMTNGMLGLAVVVDKNQDLCGIITDGDLRRAMNAKTDTFFQLGAADIMTANPKCIDPEARLFDIQQTMNNHKINSLLVTEGKKAIGVVQIYDIK